MKKSSIDSQEEARARLKEKMENKRRKQSKPLSKNPKDNDEKSGWSITFKVVRGLIVIFGIIFALAGVFGAATGVGYFARLVEQTKTPDKTEMLAKINDIHGVSVINYSNGQPISDISSDLVRVTVKSDEISPNVKNALIATEDDSFKTNKGVVPKAVVRGILGSVGGGTSSGGSTLTQQLIKQQVLGDSVTFQRKASEIVYALKLNSYLSKDQILTDYLNVSPFGRNNKGQNIAGIQEAALGIFGKSAKDLTIPEAAFIAGLPQSPIVYSPYAADGSLKSKENMSYGLERQKEVLFYLYRGGYISEADYKKYKAYDISTEFLQPGVAQSQEHGYLYNVVYNEAITDIYNYLIKRDKVSATDLGNDSTKQRYRELAEQSLQNGGYTVTTTINQQVYDAMQNAVTNYSGLMQDGTGLIQTGNVLMDNKTGAVYGFIGGLDFSQSQVNHAFDTKRSPGSSIKPILAYGPAIDMGLMGSASVLSNYPAKYSSGQDIEHVGNMGTEMMPFSEALNVSYNIPAYWTYQTILNKGKSVEPYMTKMGYDVADYSVESLPLGGGIDPTVVQHTNGYQTLANGGKYEPWYIVDSIKDDTGNVIYQHQTTGGTQVYSEATSTIMEYMLQDAIKSQKTSKFYGELQSLNSSLATNVQWAGKTGTTDNYTDVWMMLSTPSVTLGSWAGHDDNSAMSQNSGFINNAKFTANLVNAINAADPNIFGPGQKFTDPNSDPNVTKSKVLVSTGEKPGKVNVKLSNGKTQEVNLGGDTTTSFWATKSGAPTTTYDFSIGGSASDIAAGWKKILPNYNFGQ
ncbi:MULTISPECIES: transglycosylase domain-containing protein [Lactococcus]|jgi:penicillin-binding protein|uniref:transglycosylase domain-containing protein n=1 Tax=Lactococcus TaxID=1357 RepID=UPI00024D8E48|nr:MULTISPECIES: transglycosylase domain-containing protein [Lactococcus]MCA2381038.1 penicillin-binding protein [Lactococcus sp. SK2-659]MCI2094214.1 penicillin-binding protein [Lactococcus lactis]MCI2190449.1 penicillin-binding protein [Lactococcus lactis]THA55296.1 penicillin-binding protein [Lactococcus lactis]BAL50350.1 penicillin-binding protein 1B [Lactococcus lactis subsp. lactis IO-1]